MKFSEQERKQIDALLEEGRKVQEMNNNKTYTQREICEMFTEIMKGKEYLQNKI